MGTVTELQVRCARQFAAFIMQPFLVANTDDHFPEQNLHHSAHSVCGPHPLHSAIKPVSYSAPCRRLHKFFIDMV